MKNITQEKHESRPDPDCLTPIVRPGVLMNYLITLIIFLLGFTVAMPNPSTEFSGYSTVRIKIMVTDPLGARLSTVQIRVACGKSKKKLLTDEFGVVEVKLPDGKCEIELNKIGFTTLKDHFLVSKKPSKHIFEFVLKPVSWDHPDKILENGRQSGPFLHYCVSQPSVTNYSSGRCGGYKQLHCPATRITGAPFPPAWHGVVERRQSVQ